jgi:uncharacterized membrane protein
MTDVLDDPAVVAYLSALSRHLGEAPDRELVLDGVRQHIRDALAEGPADRPRVAAVLDELGDPASIASEAAGVEPRRESPFLQRRGGAILVVLLLALGGFVVPVIGWVAGVVLLWASRGWTVLDKLLGTLAPALLAVVLLGLSSLLPAEVRFSHLALVGGLVIGLILTGVYLLRRFQSSP